MALTGMGSEAHSSGEGKRNSAVAIIKHEMWRAPLESYGVLWEFMGGIYHVNFLVGRSHWALWAAVLSSAGVGEGRKSRITVSIVRDNASRTSQRIGLVKCLGQTSLLSEDVPTDLDFSPKTEPGPQDF